MAPEHVKLAAIAFTVVSVISLGLAVREWGRSAAGSPPELSERSARRGGLILLVVSLLLVIMLWGLAQPFGWGRDRTLWVGFGIFLVVMTLTRPWWFWEHYKARWLRELIGDESTALITCCSLG